MLDRPQQPDAHDDSRNAPSALGRRTMLRGAVHAAWAVPAVTVVSAAPAMATSPPLSDWLRLQAAFNPAGTAISTTSIVISTRDDWDDDVFELSISSRGAIRFDTAALQTTQGPWVAPSYWIRDTGVTFQLVQPLSPGVHQLPNVTVPIVTAVAGSVQLSLSNNLDEAYESIIVSR